MMQPGCGATPGLWQPQAWNSWSRRSGSNRRPSDYKSDALPTELHRQTKKGGPFQDLLLCLHETSKFDAPLYFFSLREYFARVEVNSRPAAVVRPLLPRTISSVLYGWP